MKVLLNENYKTCHFGITVDLAFYEDMQCMVIFAYINFVQINIANKN